MRKNFEDVLKYSEHALEIIAKEKLDAEEQKAVTEEVVDNFANFVNPGTLEYRKAAAADYTSIEWIDEGDGFYDLHGKKYIDWLGGFGVFTHGHRHPKVVKAVKDQLKKQALGSAELLDGNRSMLAKLLAEITPGDLQYTFFTSSGTESVECAMKMAIMATGRHYFITGTNDFHGKSLGALSLTGKGIYREPFLPMMQGVRHVPFGDFDYMKKTMESMAAIGELPAAVILEPIEGEVGVVIPPDDYFPKVRELCNEYDVLLVADEVQTGLGRTGKVFAVDHWGVEPDIICLAKAMGGGVMPLSATVCTKRCYEGYMYDNPWMHSTTTGGNPLACAAGIAGINVLLEEKLSEQSEEKGEYIMKKLAVLQKKYSNILTEIRGKGLLIVMIFCDDEKGYQVVTEMFGKGVLLSGTETNAHAIRIEPPLTISYENIDIGLEKLDESLAKVAKAK